jgi:hypothetical protein
MHWTYIECDDRGSHHGLHVIRKRERLSSACYRCRRNDRADWYCPEYLPSRALGPEPLAQAAWREPGVAAGRDRRVAHEAGALRGQDLKGPRSTPRCSRRPSPFRPIPSCCIRPSKDSTPGEKARRQAAAILFLHGKAAAMMARPYAHAKQFRRHQRRVHFQRSRGWAGSSATRKSEGPASTGRGVAPPLG